jgi:quercetin dioxygenase-like cupin family protein
MDEYGLRARSMSVPVRKPHVAVLVAGEETEGAFALIETVEAKDAQLPRRLHNREDQALYVLEGFLNVWVAGRWVDVPAGTAVFLPRGVEHAFVVATETARMLIFIVPVGFEGFYREVGATGTSSFDIERLVATAARSAAR